MSDTFLDKTDPRGIYSLVPMAIRKTMEEIDPEDLQMGEDRLKAKYDPDHFICRLRFAFWREYDAAQAQFRDISIPNIAMLMGVPSNNILTQLRIPRHLAWVLCVPASYDIVLAEAEQHGFKRVREILDIDIYNNDGTVNATNAKLLLQAVSFIDMRKNGAIVQKQLHVHTSTKDVKNFANNVSIETLDAKIKELEKRGTINDAIVVTAEAEAEVIK